MIRTIATEPLTEAAFAPFGDVLEARGSPDKRINGGLCARFHNRARIDIAGRTGLSVFLAEPRALPYSLDLIERHPSGSQAFIPMHGHPFLVIVAASPEATPRAFLTDGAQGVNLHRGIWHGVLTPLHAPGLFSVIDRCADSGDPDRNLEEHRFDTPWTVTRYPSPPKGPSAHDDPSG